MLEKFLRFIRIIFAVQPEELSREQVYAELVKKFGHLTPKPEVLLVKSHIAAWYLKKNGFTRDQITRAFVIMKRESAGIELTAEKASQVMADSTHWIACKAIDSLRAAGYYGRS